MPDIERELRTATSDGLFPLVSYAIEFDSTANVTRVVLLTTNIKDLPLGHSIFREVAGEDYNLGRHFPIALLLGLEYENTHIFRTHQFELAGQIDPRIIGREAQFEGPALYQSKGFALVDITGFSILQSSDQLAYLISLENALESSIRRCRPLFNSLNVEPTFRRASTGDGYYFWHSDIGGNADVATFLVLVCTMGFVESRRLLGGFGMRLKGAFTVGSAFTFSFRTEEASVQQNAIGPATNELARLISAAKPSQVLIKDFKKADESGNVTLTPSVLAAETVSLLHQEGLGSSALTFDPPSVNNLPPLRIIDKHGMIHHCWNLVGEIQKTLATDEERNLSDQQRAQYQQSGGWPQRIGLRTDPAQEIADVRFKTDI